MTQRSRDLDGFRDQCGVVGIWGHDESAKLAYLTLYALQHRGQDSAGIVSKDQTYYHRQIGLGLVADVFNEEVLKKLPGRASIGHVRYTTAGCCGLEEAQPFLMKTGHGHLAVAHNGNLIDADKKRVELERDGAIFHSTSDTELICHFFAKSQATDVVARLRDALNQVTGAYSLVMFADGKLIATRDPHGVRPLVLGQIGTGYVVASEDCAFDLIEAKLLREIAPGEMVVIDDTGVESHFLPAIDLPTPAPCIFEHVYFARPDSRVFGVPVHRARKEMGRLLAKESPVNADVVIAVPDSGNLAAMGYAQASGIPFELGLVRNHYVGRTFIEPETRIRDFGVRLKLCAIKEVVAGRRVIVVDDSLVRGTTSKKIVSMLRSFGATEIHLRIAAPKTIHPCFYGIDTPSQSELIAATGSLAQITQYLEADSLAYLSLDGLHMALKNEDLDGRSTMSHCDACFSGRYPIQLVA